MAGTPYTSVYENLNPNVADTVASITWKYDHEYLVYIQERDIHWEVGVSYVLTSRAGIDPSHRGFIAKHLDAWVVFDQTDMKIKTQSRKGTWCPIIKIMERPVTYGVTDHTSENWEEWWTGTAVQVNQVWEDDYEYFVLSNLSYSPGSLPWARYVTSLHFFTPAEFDAVYTSGDGYMRPTPDGAIQLFRPAAGGSSGRVIASSGNVSVITKIYRRKIRFDIAATTQFNSWFKKQVFSFPQGIYAGNKWRDAKPCAWEYDKELVIMSLDCKGPDELASSYFVPDTAVFNAGTDVANFAVDAGLVTEAGPDHSVWLFNETWDRRAMKHVYTNGKDGALVYVMYEKLPTLDSEPVDPPDPDPKPPSCTDCVPAGTIWEQPATIEVKFLSPDDWQLRNYRYVWGGDIGNGTVELVSTEENGRIAKIRLVKQIAEADSSTMFPVNISVQVFDEDYSYAGISATDDAVITFELPCVIVANAPDISIEDLTVIEGDSNHVIQVKISTSEIVQGGPITVDWYTVDRTATSDLSVKALAYDTLGNPFIVIIENLAGDRRVYIDGAFPKFYNMFYDQRNSDPTYMNTLIFTKNIITWLSNGKTGGSVLLMGDDVNTGSYPQYTVKGTFSDVPNGSLGFNDYFQAACTQLGKTLVTRFNSEIAADPTFGPTYFDQFDCVIYISSNLSRVRQNAIPLVEALRTSHYAGLGIAVIGDHGVDNDPDGYGFYKGANEILDDFYGIKLQGSIDREQMFLTVEDAITGQGNHPLWTGMSGRINSGNTEAYVDASNQAPDYVSARGTATIADGTDTALVDITIIGDDEIENIEFFEIHIENASRGNIIKDVGTITINDDDANPCGVDTPSGGAGVTETTHYLGSEIGTVTLSFDMYSVSDMLEIFYEGVCVAATSPDFSNPYSIADGTYYNVPGGNKDAPGPVSGSGTLSFYYPGMPSATTFIARVTGPDGTGWTYRFDCPVPTGSVWDGSLAVVPTSLADHVGSTGAGNVYKVGLDIGSDGKVRKISNETGVEDLTTLGDWKGTIANNTNSEVRIELVSAANANFTTNASSFVSLNTGKYCMFSKPIGEPSETITIRIYLRESGSTTNVEMKEVTLSVGELSGGVGAGCFKYGTLITMSDGTKKEIEDVVVGDVLKTFYIDGMPDADAEDPLSYLDWNEVAIAPVEATCVVTGVQLETFSYYYRLRVENAVDPICVTVEHPVLVKHPDSKAAWKWSFPKLIAVGDYMLNELGKAVKVLTKELVVETINTANLNVENLDTYFAGGLFVHNNDGSPINKD